MKFFENKKILYRFEAGDKHGFGHLKRSIEFIKFLSTKNFKIDICTSRNTKKYININDLFYFYKNKEENENEYILRVSEAYKNYIIIIDCKYDYSRKAIKNLSKNNSVIFFQNFSNGVGYADKMVIPDSHSYQRKIKLNFKKTKIYYGSKYLILRDEVFNSNKIKTKKYLTINFGATDPNNISETILRLLIISNWKHRTYLMLGKGQTEINWKAKYKIPDNIKFCKFSFKKLINSELTITAFGVTTYEIAYHGTKNLIILNENKKKFKLSRKFSNTKIIGFYKRLNYNEFNKIINYYWNKKIKINNKKLILDKKAKDRVFNILKK